MCEKDGDRGLPYVWLAAWLLPVQTRALATMGSTREAGIINSRTAVQVAPRVTNTRASTQGHPGTSGVPAVAPGRTRVVRCRMPEWVAPCDLSDGGVPWRLSLWTGET
jgi:hypothetical protein